MMIGARLDRAMSRGIRIPHETRNLLQVTWGRLKIGQREVILAKAMLAINLCILRIVGDATGLARIFELAVRGTMERRMTVAARRSSHRCAAGFSSCELLIELSLE